MKVEVLDLEAELGHVQRASKVPLGEILVDVRQAKRGLKQAVEELQLMLEEKEMEGKEDGGGGSSIGLANGTGVLEEGRSSALQTMAAGSVAVVTTAAVLGGSDDVRSQSRMENITGTGGEETDGIRKLAVFIETAKARLGVVEKTAERCMTLCKDLGELFGEDVKDDGLQSSAHIFRTLVQFLDLLAEAKKVEGLA